MMLRTGNIRSALRAPPTASHAVIVPKRFISIPSRWPVIASHHHAAARPGTPGMAFPRLPFHPRQTSFATKSSRGLQQGIDTEEEKKMGQRKLTPHPESVTTESSVRHLYEPSPSDKQRPTQDGVAHDLKIIQETFSLANAPREPYWLGLAGTLPYLGTSVSTVYLVWALNATRPASFAFANHLLISPETASHLLATLEPIQLGYGAVIISFLGAIHWGLEYAEKVPDHNRTRFRYGLGVTAPIVAWPTLLMPVEFALTSQFAAFVGLYFADARASVRGWAPAWYSTYRFALTAVVGVAIAVSLIGRAKVGDASPRLTGLGEKFHERHGEEDYTQKWQDLEQKERQKVKKQEKEAKEKEMEEKRKAKEEEGKGKKEKQSKKEKGKGDDETEAKEHEEPAKDQPKDQEGNSDKGDKGDKGDKK